MAFRHNALPLRRFGPSASAPRAVRGGGWNNPASNARAGYRNRNEPDNRNNNSGFRVVVCCHKRSPGVGLSMAYHGSSASASRGLAEPAGCRLATSPRSFGQTVTLIRWINWDLAQRGWAVGW